MAGEAKRLGLTNEQAQGLVQLRHELVSKAVAKLAQDHADVKADPDLGGAHYDTTLKHVQVAMAWMFGSDQAAAGAFFDQFGLSNNKVLVRGLAKLGKGLGDDTLVTPGRDNAPGKKAPAEVLYGTA